LTAALKYAKIIRQLEKDARVISRRDPPIAAIAMANIFIVITSNKPPARHVFEETRNANKTIT